METEPKSYHLPIQSIPGLSYGHHLADLVEFREFVEARGIRTRNTRIERYIQFLQHVKNASGEVPHSASIFKNSSHGPFQSPIDWLLYVLREAHELMWIMRGFKKHTPAGLDRKLAMVVDGTDFAALDTNTESRNVQFELRIASYFCQTGCEVDLSEETDVIALTPEFAFYVECKRVSNASKLPRRLSEAKKQLQDRMPRHRAGRVAYGCIAADVTKVGFDHNGLTFAQTPEHSRDIIRAKLAEIGDSVTTLPLFEGSSNLLLYWLQIHIPSLIIHPPTRITRFSSEIIPNHELNSESQKALATFHYILTGAPRADERESATRPLRVRKSVDLPAGTSFWLDYDLLVEFQKSGRVTGKSQEQIIGGLSLNGIEHHFSFPELEMLVSSRPDAARQSTENDLNRTRLDLVMGMYLRRYPYEDSPTDVAD